MPTDETSSQPEVDAVRGEHTGLAGTGVRGISNSGPGVHAVSASGRGLEASSTTNYGIRASSVKSAGLRASSAEGRGLEGWSTDHEGVVGTSKSGVGVYGTGTGAIGVVGDSQTGMGKGVEGRSSSNTGVNGLSDSGRGVEGRSNKSDGVFGFGRVGGSFEGSFEGVHAVGHDPRAAGLAGYNDNTGPAIYGKNTGGGPAAYFDGNVVVTGVIQMTRADYAEEFTVTEQDQGQAEPGMVMVLDDHGEVSICREAYDMRVVGVVSGAGLYKPAVVLDHQEELPNRLPLALMGKVYCRVDASVTPIRVGDLLTPSAVPGHAMKVTDPLKSFGAVIGKALQPLTHGRGLLPILVRLQ